VFPTCGGAGNVVSATTVAGVTFVSMLAAAASETVFTGQRALSHTGGAAT
jgi:hypothetical protein